MLAWTQRLHRSYLHRDPEMFARYLLRLYLAAPGEMTELAGLHHDGNDHNFTGEVQEPLRQAREAARHYELSEQNEATCARLAKWAEETVEAIWVTGEGEPLTGREAVEIGADQAAREAAQRGQSHGSTRGAEP